MTSKKHVFVDGSHVLMTIRQKSGARNRTTPLLSFNYTQMIDEILREEVLGEHSAIFLSRPPNGRTSYLSYEDEQLFHERSFAVHRYELHERRVECFRCNHTFNQYREKPVDAAIIVAMFKAALRAGADESIVLVSGDGDFLEAVEEIMNPNGGYGVSVQVYGFLDSTNREFMHNPQFNFQSLDPYLETKRVTTRAVRRRVLDKPWPRTNM